MHTDKMYEMHKVFNKLIANSLLFGRTNDQVYQQRRKTVAGALVKSTLVILGGLMTSMTLAQVKALQDKIAKGLKEMSPTQFTNQLLLFGARVGVRRTPIFFGREAIKANQKGFDALVAAGLNFQTAVTR